MRLLLDGFGSHLTGRDLLDRMSGAGVEIAWFRKPLYLSPLKQNHRCHRKVLVADERTAFTGGVGIAEEWCGDARNPDEWRDTHVEVRGPAVDGIVPLIGSTNFNRRSLDHDEEVVLAVMDAEFTAALDAHYDENIEVSEPIRPGRRKRRSLPQRARETETSRAGTSASTAQ